MISSSIGKIVVVGGGVIGNSIAYFLARDYGKEVTIVDPVGIAPAASGKAGGFLALEWRDDDVLMRGLHRRGFELHDELAEDLDGTSRYGYRRLSCMGVEVDLSQQPQQQQNEIKTTTTTSSSFAAHSMEKPDKSSSHKKTKDDWPLEWIDNEDVVLDVWKMGDESNVGQVHPKLFCETLFEYCQQKVGTQLHVGKVTKMCFSSSDHQVISGVECEDGSTLEADVVVIACGPWSQQILELFPKILKNDVMFGLKCASMLVDCPDKGVLSQAIFLEGSEDEYEVYPRPDGTVYINGWTQDGVIVQEEPSNESIMDDANEFFLQVTKQISSQLSSAKPHTLQSCYMPYSRTGDPIIGKLPHYKNAFLAAGHGPWGIQQGPSTGEAIAQIIMEGEAKNLPNIDTSYSPSNILQSSSNLNQ